MIQVDPDPVTHRSSGQVADHGLKQVRVMTELLYRSTMVALSPPPSKGTRAVSPCAPKERNDNGVCLSLSLRERDVLRRAGKVTH